MIFKLSFMSESTKGRSLVPKKAFLNSSFLLNSPNGSPVSTTHGQRLYVLDFIGLY